MAWMGRSVAALVVQCALLSLLLCGKCLCNANAEEDLVSDLLHLQSGTSDGVIALNNHTLQRFASSHSPRPYNLLLFFDALMLRANSELQLEQLRGEFALLASSYIKNNAGSEESTKLFFCSLEFGQSQSSFTWFGVNSLPHIRLLPSGSGSPEESLEVVLGGSSRSAEAIAAFLESRANLKIGQINRPPLISKLKIGILLCGLMVAAPFVIKKLASQNTPLHKPQIWCIGALLVFFFSVSGGMHNIIRNMPLFIGDKGNPGRLVFFLEGSEMQLGAEGFLVGLLYTMVGLILAFMSHILVHLKSRNTQRLIMLLGLGVSYFAVRKVIALNNWKTGYWVTSYWPKRWS